MQYDNGLNKIQHPMVMTFKYLHSLEIRYYWSWLKIQNGIEQIILVFAVYAVSAVSAISADRAVST